MCPSCPEAVVMLPVFLPVLHDVTSCAAACRACVCVCECCCVVWACGCGPWWDPAATGLPVVCSTQTRGANSGQETRIWMFSWKRMNFWASLSHSLSEADGDEGVIRFYEWLGLVTSCMWGNGLDAILSSWCEDFCHTTEFRKIGRLVVNFCPFCVKRSSSIVSLCGRAVARV